MRQLLPHQQLPAVVDVQWDEQEHVGRAHSANVETHTARAASEGRPACDERYRESPQSNPRDDDGREQVIAGPGISRPELR